MSNRKGAKVKRHNHTLKVLSDYLEEENLSEFAGKIEISPAYLTMVLNGQRKPSLAICNRIIQETCLEVRLQDLRPDLYSEILAYNKMCDGT
jgi:transcriptional regulator with XRE-family HTH domain